LRPTHHGVRLRGVSTSDRAELATLRAQLEELAERATAVAARYGDTPDSAVAADLYSAERALFAARRAFDRAAAALEE
jgi:hypothetical protein